MRLISSVALVGMMAATACAASLALGEGQIVKGGIEIKVLGASRRMLPAPWRRSRGPLPSLAGPVPRSGKMQATART